MLPGLYSRRRCEERGDDMTDDRQSTIGNLQSSVALVSRKDVMRMLGIGKHKLRTLVECGVLTPVHYDIGEDGRPKDRAVFKLRDVEAVVGRN